jgi:hypothetical protein
MLWTLESWGNLMRTRCSDVLYTYLTHLNIFSMQVGSPAELSGWFAWQGWPIVGCSDCLCWST